MTANTFYVSRCYREVALSNLPSDEVRQLTLFFTEPVNGIERAVIFQLDRQNRGVEQATRLEIYASPDDFSNYLQLAESASVLMGSWESDASGNITRFVVRDRTTSRKLQSAINLTADARTFGWGDSAKRFVERVGEATRGLIENTMDDLKLIYGSVATCARELDRVRQRVFERAIEYHQTVIRLAIEAGVIPVEIIDEVYQIVADDIRRAPNPRLWRLENIVDSIYGSGRFFTHEVTANDLDPNRRTFIYVHGWNYNGTAGSGCSFFSDVESGVGLFDPNDQVVDPASTTVLLATYDTNLLDEEETLIRRAFATVVGTGNVSLDFVLAVYWKEIERRARLSSEYFANVLMPLNNHLLHQSFTHSLGSYCWAGLAQRYLQSSAKLGATWHSFQGALPTNSFGRTGEFTGAPGAFGDYSSHVYFSLLDAVLGVAYSFANYGVTAMGTTGPIPPLGPVKRHDVTSVVNVQHGPQNYFRPIRDIVRDNVRQYL